MTVWIEKVHNEFSDDSMFAAWDGFSIGHYVDYAKLLQRRWNELVKDCI